MVKYLKGTIHQGLYYSSRSDSTLIAYSDASWGSCHLTRESFTGYCVLLGTNLISWRSKKQSTISGSSTEAEYRIMSTTVCQLLWITYILKDLHIPISLLIPLWCDNQAAIHISANSVFHKCIKHLEIDCHLVRHHYKQGFIEAMHISSTSQLANLFTKALATPQFNQMTSKLNLLQQDLT